jgi:hypothetical protein
MNGRKKNLTGTGECLPPSLNTGWQRTTMNHELQYELLINKAKNRERLSNAYYEKHHIIPKSLGGSNKNDNLVYLTGREHFVAHMLLARIYGGGMWQAAKMMKQARGGVQERYVNGRLYEIARREWTKFASGRKRPPHVIEKLLEARRGTKTSDETKAKMSATRKGRARSGDPAKWKHSDAAKQKMSETHKAINTGARLPKMYGEDNPMKRPENRAKISAAKKAYWAKIRESKSQL